MRSTAELPPKAHTQYPMEGCMCRMCVPARRAERVSIVQRDPEKSRRNITKQKRQRIYKRDGNACVACGSTSELTLDHIVPLARGGTNLDSNLRTLCHSCNNQKGAKLTEEQIRYREEMIACGYCPPDGFKVKRANMSRHLRKVHGIVEGSAQ